MSSPSKHALRICNMETWQANAFSYFKCWCKNTLSVPPDPWSSLNSLLVRDLLSLSFPSSPALIFLSFSSLLCSHECFFFHFSPSPSYFPLSLFIHLLTGHVLDSWAHSCHRCHSESLHRAWCGAACSVSLRPYTPSPRGKRSKPIISPPQPFLKWKPSQVANRGQS